MKKELQRDVNKVQEKMIQVFLSIWLFCFLKHRRRANGYIVISMRVKFFSTVSYLCVADSRFALFHEHRVLTMWNIVYSLSIFIVRQIRSERTRLGPTTSQTAIYSTKNINFVFFSLHFFIRSLISFNCASQLRCKRTFSP